MAVQAFAIDTGVGQLAHLEARNRAHARVEDRIRCAKNSVTQERGRTRRGSARTGVLTAARGVWLMRKTPLGHSFVAPLPHLQSESCSRPKLRLT